MFSITLSSYFTETPLAEIHDVKTHRSIIMRHVFYIVSPIFSYGIKPQLATVVAGSVRARVFPTPPLLVPEPPKYTH